MSKWKFESGLTLLLGLPTKRDHLGLRSLFDVSR